jgi:predicted aldo/keto reductase-like oxidoreductase
MDEQPLIPETVKLLEDYANSTAKYFCRRCGACDTANADKIPIFDIMELRMYARGYGKSDWASQRYDLIASEIQCKIAMSDYSSAEKICPQKMPISQLMKEACLELRRG